MNGTSYASYSGFNQPAPSEQITRPSVIWSSVASIFASTAGLRKLGLSIPQARRIRLVTAPIAVINVNDSSGPSFAYGSPW